MRVEIELQSARERSLFELKSKILLLRLLVLLLQVEEGDEDE